MKHFFTLGAVLCITLLACSKDALRSDYDNVEETTANTVALYSGNFQFADKQGTGKVVIYRKDNGTLSIGLEGMSLSSTAHYKVMAAASATDVGTKLFSVVGLSGTSLHDVPAHCQINYTKFILIQSEPSEAVVASAELK